MANCAETARKADATAHAKRILVVDDNPPNRILLRTMICALGYDVTLADSGLTALEMARQHTFDLVLLDMRMVPMDGIETLKHLRTQAGANTATPVIALTGSSSQEHHAAFAAAGAAAILVKPISASSLASALAAHVR